MVLFHMVVSFGFVPHAAFPALRAPALRAPAPRPPLVAMGLFDRFKEKEGDAAATPTAPPTAPPAISALDSALVKLGMKKEEECELIDADAPDLMEQIKCSGRAGIVSYVLWEWAFWLSAIPLASFGYYQATGSWPDLSDSEDQAKVAASVFAFVNVARFAVPLRVGLALSTTPWVDEKIVQPFLGKFGGDEDESD